METMVKKKSWIWGISLALLVMILSFVGYQLLSNTDQHGYEPKDVVVLYEKAVSEKDGITLKKVATTDQAKRSSEYFGISLVQHKQHSLADPGYLMKEYKLTNKDYWYEVKWFYNDGKAWSKLYRVMYTDDQEWRVEVIGEEEFKRFTDGVKAQVIRANSHD